MAEVIVPFACWDQCSETVADGRMVQQIQISIILVNFSPTFKITTFYCQNTPKSDSPLTALAGTDKVLFLMLIIISFLGVGYHAVSDGFHF